MANLTINKVLDLVKNQNDHLSVKRFTAHANAAFSGAMGDGRIILEMPLFCIFGAPCDFGKQKKSIM